MNPLRTIALLVAIAALGCSQRAEQTPVADAPPVADAVKAEQSPHEGAVAEVLAAIVDEQSKARVLTPFPGVTVHIASDKQSHVEIAGRVCLDEGYLEQVACAPNSREHESLVVITPAQPNQIHAALLMAGLEHGTPGHWTYENNQLQTIHPTGDQIDVWVRYIDRNGKMQTHPIRNWIRGVAMRDPANPDEVKRNEFPNLPWVFGGSRIAANPAFMGPGEHYVADMTGSIIGLVTFGDEVIGFSKVQSDQEDVQPMEWEIDTETIPPMETAVTVILKRWKE